MSRVFERSSKGIPGKFQICLKGVSRKFKGCSKESLKGVSRKIEGCFNGVLRVSMGFKRSSMGV